MNVDKIKEMVAERYNYADNILGNRWAFAMMVTHRKKKQLQLYEEVILEISERLDKAELSDKQQPKALIIADVRKSLAKLIQEQNMSVELRTYLMEINLKLS